MIGNLRAEGVSEMLCRCVNWQIGFWSDEALSKNDFTGAYSAKLVAIKNGILKDCMRQKQQQWRRTSGE